MIKNYDDIRGLLAEKKLPNLSGRGASDEEITAAERWMGIRFPASFRSFLSEHGWGYFGSLELISGLGADIPKEWEAGANIVRVVTDERSGPLHFPLHIIPISQNGAGDWYALDCSRYIEHECPVVFINHETLVDGFKAEQKAQNFAEWIYSKLSEQKAGATL